MKRIICIVLAFLLLFSTIGFIASGQKLSFQPLTLDYLLRCLSEFNLDFNFLFDYIDYFKAFIEKVIGILTFQDFDILGLLLLFIYPIQLIIEFVQMILVNISEVFQLLYALLQYR